MNTVQERYVVGKHQGRRTPEEQQLVQLRAALMKANAEISELQTMVRDLRRVNNRLRDQLGGAV
jgi:hypothetical protein